MSDKDSPNLGPDRESERVSELDPQPFESARRKKKKKKKISFYQLEASGSRMRAAYRNTSIHTGHLSLSDFISWAVDVAVCSLEQTYNAGRAWASVGDVPPASANPAQHQMEPLPACCSDAEPVSEEGPAEEEGAPRDGNEMAKWMGPSLEQLHNAVEIELRYKDGTTVTWKGGRTGRLG
jgi:hypothetical protein